MDHDGLARWAEGNSRYKNAVSGFCPQPSDPQLLADYRSLKGIKNVIN
jgi:hypothetical protein